LSPSAHARLWAMLLPTTLGILVRPELALLGAILGVELAILRLRPLRGLRTATTAVSLAAAALPLALWVWFAATSFGSVFPQTAAAKLHSIGTLEAGWYAARVAVAAQAPALLAVAGAAVGLAVARRRPSALAVVVLAWAGALAGFYIAGGYYPLARYLLPGLGCLPIAAVALLELAARSSQHIQRRVGRLALMTAVVALAGWAVVTFWRVLPNSGGESCETYRVFVDHLEQHAGPDDAVATMEIGALAYFGRWRLIDFCGLILPEDLQPLREDKVALLEATRPAWSTFYAPVPGAHFEPVVRRRVRVTQASDPRVDEMMLYEITWATTPQRDAGTKPR
jgi:hypothetical protein